MAGHSANFVILRDLPRFSLTSRDRKEKSLNLFWNKEGSCGPSLADPLPDQTELCAYADAVPTEVGVAMVSPRSSRVLELPEARAGGWGPVHQPEQEPPVP